MKITTVLFGDLAIIPYQPQRPVAEKLEWLTDVFISHNGTETRTQKREFPRQTFDYTIPLSQWKKIESLNTVKGGIRQKWAVPIWTEAQSVGDLSLLSIIACDTYENYFFKNETLCFIHGADQSWQVGEIDSVSPASISLTESITAVNDAYIMPLKQAYIVGNVQHLTNGLESTVKIKFLIQDYTEITEAVPDQYESEDIHAIRTIANGQTNRDVSQKQDLIDFGIGDVDSHTVFPNSHYGSQMNFVQDGPAKVQEYRQFLYRCAGKFRNFWLPTFENDMINLSTGLVTTSLIVGRDSIDDYAMDRPYINILTKDGTHNQARINSAVALDSERIQLGFATSLDIEAEDIALISYLGYNRLDVDSVELRWIGNNVVESEIRTIESNFYE